MREETRNIHDPDFVKEVFDRCGRNYRYWSAVASFGFIRRWRRQCVASLPLPDSHGTQGVDLMAGTGEVWPHLLRRHPGIARITAIDISHQMHLQAVARLHRGRENRIEHLEANVLTRDLPGASADFVVATFGLKTFDPAQQRRLAAQIARLLRPGGGFALVEATDPTGWALRPLYRFYLDRVLPLVERLFLRGAQDFAMLGIYTRGFRDCGQMAEALRAEGLTVTETRLFFGCAGLLSGRKPA